MSGTKVATAKGKSAKPVRRPNVAERRRRVERLRGKYAWIPYSSEDFVRDKRREIALEDRA